MKFVATINDETLSESTDHDYELRYIDIGNVDSLGRINNTVNYKFQEAPSRARRKVQTGDIIISTVRTYLQAITQIEDLETNDLIVSTGFAVVRPKRSILAPGFCKYLFRDPKFLWEVTSRSVGVSYPAINATELANIYVDIPGLKVQEKISEYLDKEISRIDALIEEKKRMKIILEEKSNAFVNRIIERGINPSAELKPAGISWLNQIPAHWESLRLKYLAIYQVSNVDKVRSESEQPVILCNYTDVYNNDFINADMELMSASANEHEIHKFRLKEGDIIITKDSESWNDIAIPAYVVTSTEDLLCGYHLAIIRTISKKLNRKFLFYCLKSKVIRLQLELVSKGVTRFGLPIGAIGCLKLPIPPLNEQNEIITQIERFEKYRKQHVQLINKSVDILKERRVTLISEAVAGKNKAYMEVNGDAFKL